MCRKGIHFEEIFIKKTVNLKVFFPFLKQIFMFEILIGNFHKIFLYFYQINQIKYFQVYICF